MNENIYNQSKIYKIEPTTEHEEHEMYIGSTTKKYLSQRLQQHKSSYKTYLDNISSKYSIYDLFNKNGVENFNIYLLENYHCNDINTLRAKKGNIYKKQHVLKKVEGRTYKVCYNDNKNEILSHQKEYYDNDKIKYYNDKRI